MKKYLFILLLIICLFPTNIQAQTKIEDMKINITQVSKDIDILIDSVIGQIKNSNKSFNSISQTIKQYDKKLDSYNNQLHDLYSTTSSTEDKLSINALQATIIDYNIALTYLANYIEIPNQVSDISSSIYYKRRGDKFLQGVVLN